MKIGSTRSPAHLFEQQQRRRRTDVHSNGSQYHFNHAHQPRPASRGQSRQLRGSPAGHAREQRRAATPPRRPPRQSIASGLLAGRRRCPGARRGSVRSSIDARSRARRPGAAHPGSRTSTPRAISAPATAATRRSSAVKVVSPVSRDGDDQPERPELIDDSTRRGRVARWNSWARSMGSPRRGLARRRRDDRSARAASTVRAPRRRRSGDRRSASPRAQRGAARRHRHVAQQSLLDQAQAHDAQRARTPPGPDGSPRAGTRRRARSRAGSPCGCGWAATRPLSS